MLAILAVVLAAYFCATSTITSFQLFDCKKIHLLSFRVNVVCLALLENPDR